LAKLAYIGFRPVSPVVSSLNDLIKHNFTTINKQILLNIELKREPLVIIVVSQIEQPTVSDLSSN